MTKRFRIVVFASVASCALTSQQAVAQDTAALPPAVTPVTVAGTGTAANSPKDTGDIIVTAQRRSESLQRTPVAVSVLSGAVLAQRAITTESDLQVATPGLTVRASQNSNQLNYSIRGQNLDAFSNTRPGVLPYFNEIQVGGAGGASAFYDLQSIQVLKGPQGTLFGRNATGGAVLFTSVKPQNEFSGYIDGKLGNYNLRQIEGAINVPLAGGKIKARMAGFFQKRDGYQFNAFKNERAGNIDRFGLRGSVTILLSDQLKNDLVVDYLHSGGNNSIGGVYSLNPPGLVPALLLTNFGNVAVFDSIFGPGASAAYAASHPKLDPGGIASYINTQRARGPYVVESNGPNKYLGRNLIVSNVTTFELNGTNQIKNIFGFTKLINDVYGDIDGTPYGIDDNGVLGRRDKTRQVSDELQLIGKTPNLNYVTGVYFSDETNRNITGSDLFDFPFIHALQNNTARTGSKTYAIYAQGTYDLTRATGIEGLGITAGVRYTKEKLHIQILPDDVSFLDSPAVQLRYQPYQKKSYGNLSWTLGVQDQVNSNLLLYAVTRRSYRNGGYNGVVRPVPGLGNAGGNGYDLETVTDAEIGAKFRGAIGATRLTLNAAAYTDWIKKAQRVAYTLVGGSPAAVTVNVPKAKVKGFELDTQIEPSPMFMFGGALNYTDAKFTDNLVSVSGGTPVEFGTYPDTPKWSGSLFAQAKAPISGSITGSARAEVYKQTSTYFSSTGNLNPGTKLPGYELANLRFAIENEQAGWSVAALVKNVFKKVYYVGGVGIGELFQFNTAVPGDPRTFIINGRFKF